MPPWWLAGEWRYIAVDIGQMGDCDRERCGCLRTPAGAIYLISERVQISWLAIYDHFCKLHPRQRPSPPAVTAWAPNSAPFCCLLFQYHHLSTSNRAPVQPPQVTLTHPPHHSLSHTQPPSRLLLHIPTRVNMPLNDPARRHAWAKQPFRLAADPFSPALAVVVRSARAFMARGRGHDRVVVVLLLLLLLVSGVATLLRSTLFRFRIGFRVVRARRARRVRGRSAIVVGRGGDRPTNNTNPLRRCQFRRRRAVQEQQLLQLQCDPVRQPTLRVRVEPRDARHDALAAQDGRDRVAVPRLDGVGEDTGEQVAQSDLIAAIWQVRGDAVARVWACEKVAGGGEGSAARLECFFARDEGAEIHGEERPDGNALVEAPVAAGTQQDQVLDGVETGHVQETLLGEFVELRGVSVCVRMKGRGYLPSRGRTWRSRARRVCRPCRRASIFRRGFG